MGFRLANKLARGFLARRRVRKLQQARPGIEKSTDDRCCSESDKEKLSPKLPATSTETAKVREVCQALAFSHEQCGQRHLIGSVASIKAAIRLAQKKPSARQILQSIWQDILEAVLAGGAHCTAERCLEMF